MKKIPKIWLWASIGLLATSASCDKKTVTPEIINEVTTTIDLGKNQTVNIGGNNYQIKFSDFEDNRLFGCDGYGAPGFADMVFEINNQSVKYAFTSCKMEQELIWNDVLFKQNIGKVNNTISFQVLSLIGIKENKSSYKTKIILKSN